VRKGAFGRSRHTASPGAKEHSVASLLVYWEGWGSPRAATKTKPALAFLVNLPHKASRIRTLLLICIRGDRRLAVKPVHRFAKALSD